MRIYWVTITFEDGSWKPVRLRLRSEIIFGQIYYYILYEDKKYQVLSKVMDLTKEHCCKFRQLYADLRKGELI